MKAPIKTLHWTPRILCILAILFISMFAADAYDPALNFGQLIIAFSMHLIPSFILLAFLIVAWKWELIGGIMFALIGLGTSPFVFLINHNRNHFSIGASLMVVLLVNLPFVVVGALFLLSHFMKKRNVQTV